METPKKESMIYEDDKVYVCLASHPIVRGHTIVVWKKPVKDLHLLSKEDYEYLMVKVDEVRNALIRTLDLNKVYLIYMDEVGHVHWHLVPRYNEKGFDIFRHEPTELKDFSLANRIKCSLVCDSR